MNRRQEKGSNKMVEEVKRKEESLVIVIYEIDEWRDWLDKNHLNEKKVGLISYKKHTGKKSISHKEAMFEAICFGWIDTTIKRLDDERFVRYFVRRGDKANWSKNTLGYGKELLASGRMSEFGIKRYKEGLKKKPHDHGIPKNPEMPELLRRELEKIENRDAKEKFGELTTSAKKEHYRFILRAKTDETKMRRVKSLIESLKED